MDYELKLRRHASREIDKYWENFQKSTSYQHLLTVPGFSQVPPDEIRLILVTFFVHAFDNLRSTIQALDTEHVAAGLQETLQTYHDDALDRSESLAIAAELLKTFMIWLIATNEIKLTILEFVDALMNVFVTATYLLGLTEEEALTSPFGNDDFDLPGVDDAFSDPDNDVDFDSENMAELFQLTMTFLESKTWLQVPKPVQNQELFGATTLFLAHTIQSLFGHDAKNWTAQDIKAAMSMLLYDKKTIGPDQRAVIGQMVAIFIRSTTTSHLWTPTQRQALATAAESRVQELVAAKPAPQQPTSNPTETTTNNRVVPIAGWQKHKHDK